MQVVSKFCAVVSKSVLFWSSASRRRRVAIGLISIALIIAGWAASEWYRSWPVRLALTDKPAHYPLAFSPDGSKLVVSIPDGFSLRDARTGRKLADWKRKDGRRGVSGKFSPDGKIFEAFYQNHIPPSNERVDLIDVATGEVGASFPRPLPNIWASAFMDEGKTLRILAVEQNLTKIIDVDVATGKSGTPRPFSCPNSYTWKMMSDDGRTFATIDQSAMTGVKVLRTVLLWDIEHDRQIGVISPSVSGASLNAMCLSADGKSLLMGLSDRTIEVWDIPSATLRKRFPIHSADFSTLLLRLSPDGSKVSSLGIWRSPALSFDTARFFLQRMAQNPNPRVHELVVHDVATGRQLGKSKDEGLMTIFSDDGRAVATSSDDGTRLRDLPPSR